MRTSHGACGSAWDQHGDRTSHCGGCHRTFSSLTAFDAHQKTAKDPLYGARPFVCLEPAGLGMTSKTDKYGASVWAMPSKGEWWKDEEDES